MGVSSRPGPAEIGNQKQQKRGRKRGVSSAQRQRWQLGTPTDTTHDSDRGPVARSSYDIEPVEAVALRNRISGDVPSSGGVHDSKSRPMAQSAATDQSQAPPRKPTAVAGSPTASTASDARAPVSAHASEPSDAQPERSGFSSPGEVARVQAGMSPFRAMQEHHRSDSNSREAGARSDSLDSASSADSAHGAAPAWNFRRQRVAAEEDGPDSSTLQQRRAKSIALERQGIAAERKGGDASSRHLHTAKGRLRNVELDPTAGGIWVPRDWTAKEGAHLTDDLILGKILGSGFQAHIFELKDQEGRLAPVVLKAGRRVALINDTQREWATGQRLAALGPGDSPLPGFMKVGPAVCRGRKRSGKGTKLSGMVLERINGRSVDKIVTDPEFHDIYYIQDMLREVFTALDAAQRAFGFHHYDLRLDNVMEHRPDKDQDASDPVSRSMVGEAHERSEELMWKVIDFGLAKFDEMYAADEGADVSDVSEPKRSAWYMAPFRTLKSTPELIHRAAWSGKSDVYHILFDLSQKMHGRVWPARDRATVQRCISMIRHVCGVKPSVSFYDDSAGQEAADPPVQCLPVQCFGVPSRDRTGFRGRRRDFVHRSYVLRYMLQLKAWQFPTNPGLTAGEILQGPFFRDGGY